MTKSTIMPWWFIDEPIENGTKDWMKPGGSFNEKGIANLIEMLVTIP